MPASVTLDVSAKIQALLSSRRTHEAAIADIDRILDAVGKLLGGKPTVKAVVKAARSATGRSKIQRGTFAISGRESILAFVKQKGSPTTAEINANWTAEGRSGPANKVLGRLVEDGKLRREKVKGGQGSRYTLIGAVSAPAAVKPAPRGVKGTFAMTGTESVLKFIRTRRNPTTALINAHWTSEGRKRSADDTLGKLVREKKIKRQKNKDGKGSRYSLA